MWCVRQALCRAWQLQPSCPSQLSKFAQMSSYVPYVIERKGRGERVVDIYSRMLTERVLCVNGPINDAVSHSVVTQLLYLESEDPEKPVHMYINSPGGVVTAGLAIYDTMQYIQCPIHTTCIGQAASMGSLLLAAGENGCRWALPHARIMMHQPTGGAQGQATDINIQAAEITHLRQLLYDLYKTHTNMSRADVEARLERDHFLDAKGAQELGIIDHVISKRTAPEDA